MRSQRRPMCRFPVSWDLGVAGCDLSLQALESFVKRGSVDFHSHVRHIDCAGAFCRRVRV